MSDEFNAYHLWLGIPPTEQPPHYYRLLGIEPFESNQEVIARAADRQAMKLKSVQAGPHMQLSQKLLNEVSVAKVCLLDAKKKGAYDATLIKNLQPAPIGIVIDTSAKSSLAAESAMDKAPTRSVKLKASPVAKAKKPRATGVGDDQNRGGRLARPVPRRARAFLLRRHRSAGLE